jgi:HD-GYP domain-containing protein (c-di-GMP phosphodiesterase class II)
VYRRPLGVTTVIPQTPTRQAGATAPAASVATSEVLAALSRALDLTEGQPLGHSVRACVIGMRLGESIGLSEEELAALYYALLLKDAGCSSNAARMAALYGSDDQAIKPRLKTVDWDDRVKTAFETWRNTGLNASLWSRMNYFLGIARQENVAKEIIAARCERGADIARRLGFPESTVHAIHSLDEHWNGKGYPDGKRGDEIPLLSRILNVAQTIEVFLARDGLDVAIDVLRERRGRWFEPRLVDEVLSWNRDSNWWRSINAPNAEENVRALEPVKHARTLDERGLDEVAQAFADIIDAKSPFTYRHSSNVAMYACAIGQVTGFDRDMMRRTHRAGLLHDIGKVGVSNRILDKKGPLDAAERSAMQLHPKYTLEILSRVNAFAGFAHQAALHHEKLDGSGYPWGVAGEVLDQMARVLAVADVYEALTADRPYRIGMEPEAAFEILNDHRGAKLDAAAIDALASAVHSQEKETL